jgi:ABC-type multidrug transport system fused ATPase/permease subunit
MWIGWAAAAVTGLGMPSFVFLIGDVIDSFGTSATDPDEALRTISLMSLIFTLVGIVIWITSYVSYAFLLIFSERIARKTRIKYLEAILR